MPSERSSLKHNRAKTGTTAKTMTTRMTCCSVCTCHVLPVMAKVAAAAQGPIDIPARPALNITEYTLDLEPT